MKLKNVRFGILLLKTCLIFGWNVCAQNRVVIDPGHGGKDSGAIGQKNAIEKDIVLLVAEEIVKLNKVVFNDRLNIYLTRYTDTLIRLSDRSKLAKVIEADVFISLHCNHAPNTSAKGIEVYVFNRYSEFSNESIYLGYELQRQFKEKLGFRSRGVKFANFQVLRETTGSMSSVLIELGFLSNADESSHFQKPESYQALALVLLESLIQNLDSYERNFH